MVCQYGDERTHRNRKAAGVRFANSQAIASLLQVCGCAELRAQLTAGSVQNNTEDYEQESDK